MISAQRGATGGKSRCLGQGIGSPEYNNFLELGFGGIRWDLYHGIMREIMREIMRGTVWDSI